jgi:outer membrane protein
MNKFILIAALLGAACLSPVVSLAEEQQAGGGFAFIDLDSVFTNYHKTKVAEAQLKDQADEIKAERKTMIEQFETVQADYQALRAQAQNTALSEDARNMKRGEAEEKLIEVRDMESKIRRLEESAQRRIDDQSRRARKRLVDEINLIIRDYAFTKNYTAIIDTSGESLNGVPTVVFYNPNLDITAEITALVNAKK